MRKLIISSLISSVFVLAISLITTGAVYAQEGESPPAVTTEAREQIKERVQGRLDEARKKICEKRSANITRLMNHAASQGEKHLATFTKIADRVKTFYTSKELNVANYADLVAAVDAKKTAAEAAIAKVKEGISFSCSDENPVGRVDQFKEKTKAMHQALKEYRTAIKNLLVAVKTAAGAKEEQS